MVLLEMVTEELCGCGRGGTEAGKKGWHGGCLGVRWCTKSEDVDVGD